MELSTDAQPSMRQPASVRQLADGFENAWKASRTATDAPTLAAFVPPPEDSLREAALQELIRIDLAMRWQRGQRVCLEEYLEKFRELEKSPAVLARLLFVEYCIRHEYGDKPDPSVYQIRFPEVSPEVERLIEQEKYKTVVAPAGTVLPPTSPPATAPPVGQDGMLQVGAGYRLLKRIGSGAFGEVWRAVAPGGIPVAIKIIFRPMDHEFAQRELQSLELIKSLSHPYLVQTQAYWPLEDRLVIVMELADGNLSGRLKECQAEGQSGIPAAELLGYFREAAEALDYLHGERVQHRDIKPDNILLLRRHAKVADFGLARLQEGIRLVNATACGTPAYMAPEVWKGKISAHSDQYSLAMTYIELRLGRPPFPVNDMVQMMEGHLKHQPDVASLDRSEQEVILKAVAKDADQRYGSCREFTVALSKALGVALAGDTLTDLRSTQTDLGSVDPRLRRSPLLTWAIRCVWLLLACGLGLVLALAAYRWNLISSGPSSGSFSLEAPPPVTVVTGKRATFNLRLQRDHFEEPVHLGFKGLPSGVQIAETTLAGNQETVLLEVAASQDARPSVGSVLVQAESGGRQTEAALDLTVLLSPTGAEPEGDEILVDSSGLKFFKRIACHLPNDNERIEFVVVPRKRREDPDTFYIMKDKVSVGLFRKFADANPNSIHTKSWNPDNLGNDYPAFGMSVEDAYRFASEGLHGHLPTTRQWDKAAGRYDPGDREGPYLGKWSAKSKLAIAADRGGPLRVGEAKDDLSPFDCRDMAGNGLEWTRDCSTGGAVPLPRAQQPKATVDLRGLGYTSSLPLSYKELEKGKMAAWEYSNNIINPEIGFRVVIER